MRPSNFAMYPRAALMLLADRFPGLLDAGLTRGNPEGGMCPELLADLGFREFWRRHRKPFLPQTEWSKFRYLAVLDGVSGASRLACTLLSGSIVLRQMSPYYNWFERWLIPNDHFVPVAYDLHDLAEQVIEARQDIANTRLIPQRARAFLNRVFTPSAILCYLSRLLMTYRNILGFAPGPPTPEEGWKPLYERKGVAAEADDVPDAFVSRGLGSADTSASSLTSTKHEEVSREFRRSKKGVARRRNDGAASPKKTTKPVDTAQSAYNGSPDTRGSPECLELIGIGKTRRGLACYTEHHNRNRMPGEGEGDFNTTWLKLKHDAEMLDFLGKARMPPGLQEAPTLFQGVLKAADVYRKYPTRKFSIQIPDEKDRELWKAVHNKNVYVPPSATLQLPQVLNPKLNFEAIENTYFSNAAKVDGGVTACTGAEAGGGWVVVDDVFTPRALEALRAYLTESTFYYFPKFGGHYLSSLLEDGMAAPLVAQVAEELQRRFPRILGKHPLRTAWAFKFDNTLNETLGREQLGVGVHADSAAVNLNFWPIEADPEDRGGLTLYKVGAPADMSFAEFNDPKQLKDLSEKAPREEIDYRANRLVIFNSNLLHETGPLRFGPGYLRRRINLTLLFGKRCGAT
eukprot:TRINITY_DN12940_c0_g4_i1.p1 TRINITY_DN12940_c0_g4~~TRINITY_DN12940_c0_g4_i1.p1  ORF type:complete len:629 (+),score=94.08 TRINITY_DN12940_c0_g4_i1:874-2760(+)